MSDISPPVAAELVTFRWPIDTVEEARRLLLQCPCSNVRSATVCEFTRAVADEHERLHRVVTISVDVRAAVKPGAHLCLPVQQAMPILGRWQWVCAFPPCTHQTLSDTYSRLSPRS